jgi:hypothetical protein
MSASSPRPQFITAMLIVPASWISDSGGGMGAANIGQARPGTVCRTDRRLLTCANVREEPLRSPAYLADKDTCGQLDGRGDVRHR